MLDIQKEELITHFIQESGDSLLDIQHVLENCSEMCESLEQKFQQAQSEEDRENVMLESYTLMVFTYTNTTEKSPHHEEAFEALKVANPMALKYIINDFYFNELDKRAVYKEMIIPDVIDTAENRAKTWAKLLETECFNEDPEVHLIEQEEKDDMALNLPIMHAATAEIVLTNIDLLRSEMMSHFNDIEFLEKVRPKRVVIDMDGFGFPNITLN